MPQQNSAGPLASHGAALIDQGYEITPIRPGSKAPPDDGWQKQGSTKGDLKKWLDGGWKNEKGIVQGPRGGYGVGIKCGKVSGVDLDSMDPAFIRHMLDWIEFEFGLGPVRVGLAPKTLILFRAETPFRKIFSNDYRDDLGDKHRLEVLGIGQQFVAFHTHPDTGKPYRWTSKATPLNTAFNDLPTLSEVQAKALAAEFNRKAEELGWTIKRKAREGLNGHAVGGPVDIFAADAPRTQISDEELHDKLMMIEADDYEIWTNVGMALWHQYEGGDKGLELWHEWSETSDKYEPSALDSRWPTFDGRDKGRAPMTARYIIKLAQEATAEAQAHQLVDAKTAINNTKDIAELRKVCEGLKKTEFDAPARVSLLGTLRAKFKLLENTILPMGDARNMIRYEAPAQDRTMPTWLDGWCFVIGENVYFNTHSRMSIIEKAFNTAFSVEMMSRKDILEGRSEPEVLPSHAAINVFQIEQVDGKRYMPGEELFFRMEGQRYVNTFSEAEFPTVPKKLTEADRAAVETVERHAEHLIPDERDRSLFLSFLAYIVQTMQRPNWAVFLQGVQGDGKTLFSDLMSAVLGSNNVGVIDPIALEKEYNGWAEGTLISFFEEVKLQGQNRFDLMNKIKPYITNSVLSVRRMRTDWYKIMNRTAYVFMSNFVDGLPIQKGETRYYTIQSRFQDPEVLFAFNSTNPDYYDAIFAAIQNHAGALRNWLLNFELHPEFSPTKRAPMNSTRAMVSELNKTDEVLGIEDAIEESTEPDISEKLLNATKLINGMTPLGGVPIYTKTINSILSQMGYQPLGRVRIGDDRFRFWSKNPESFRTAGETDVTKIKNWIEPDL